MHFFLNIWQMNVPRHDTWKTCISHFTVNPSKGFHPFRFCHWIRSKREVVIAFINTIARKMLRKRHNAMFHNPTHVFFRQFNHLVNICSPSTIGDNWISPVAAKIHNRCKGSVTAYCCCFNPCNFPHLISMARISCCCNFDFIANFCSICNSTISTRFCVCCY
ncbi:Uncharacterised protein [Streptococcus pneumoniae]|nr:Uncharacterised protein [Streptococcus pneumoniae]